MTITNERDVKVIYMALTDYSQKLANNVAKSMITETNKELTNVYAQQLEESNQLKNKISDVLKLKFPRPKFHLGEKVYVMKKRDGTYFVKSFDPKTREYLIVSIKDGSERKEQEQYLFKY